jgi:serine/threonine protein kinase
MLSNTAVRASYGKYIQQGGFGVIVAITVGTTEVARKYFKTGQQYDNEVKWNKAVGEKESDVRTNFVIKMFSCGHDDVKSSWYFDMELAEKALFDVGMDKYGGLTGCPELNTTSKVEALFTDLLNGLDFLHSCVGMLHNDIKPENILLKKNGTYAYCDFGFATPIKNAKKTFGTVAFAAPELFDDSQASVGATSDVFSLGLSLVSIFDPYQGVPEDHVNKFSTTERLDIAAEPDHNAREVLREKMRRQHHFDFFKHTFRAPIAIGRNLKFAPFKCQYAAIIALMVHPFDRAECPQLLKMFSELVQHNTIPTEIKLHEAAICHEHMNLEEVEEIIPAKPVLRLSDSKSTTIRRHVEKANHREVLSKWCVPRDCESTVTLVVKRRKTSSVE